MPSLPSSSRRLCAPSQDTREGCTVLNFSSFRGVCEVAQEQIEKAQKLETMLRGTHSQFQSICTVSPGLAQAPSSSRDDKGLRGLGMLCADDKSGISANDLETRFVGGS